MQVAGVAAIGTIATKATLLAGSFLKGFTIQPILDGFREYQTGLQSVQTIMANTGKPVKAVNRALKLGGRVLVRSAGLSPWYMRTFEENGFSPKRVAARIPAGTCTDRVNMYASTWICTKTAHVSAA